MASTIASSVRPSLRQNSIQTSSPHTPTRFVSSNFSSPGSSFRQEEDAVIIELGSRFLRAGFEGESGPQCIIPFGPEECRRVGDYRAWDPTHKIKHDEIERWGEDSELWRMDLRGLDLSLVEDKIERVVRDVYNKYLLTDAGSAQLVLVLPSIMPHPLLSSVLTTLFTRWKYSTITLLPSPAMAVVGAGLRSALVVDLGWHETIATAVYEYREVHTGSTTRGMKMLTNETGILMERSIQRDTAGLAEVHGISFDFTEDIVARLVNCKRFGSQEATDMNSTMKQMEELSVEPADDRATLSSTEDILIDIDVPAGMSSFSVQIPVSTLSQPVEQVFFPQDRHTAHLDDNEQSLPLLIYRALLSLLPDVRGICMCRIVFVGGGSSIPGLDQRVLDEVAAIVQQYGWSPVRGRKIEEQRLKLKELDQGRTGPPSARSGVPEPPGKDFVEEILQKQNAKVAQPQIGGVLRQVESLGSWAGASLLASLKIKGFVEVERQKYLSHGLTGAHREVGVSMAPQRPGIAREAMKAGDRSSWTLAGWA